MHEHVAARRSGEFVYAQHRKPLAQESFQRAGLPLPSFTGEDLQRWVETGRAQALLDLAEVGIIVDKLQQVPPAAAEGEEAGSAAGQLAEDDEDDLRDAVSALNEADHDGPAADQQEPSDELHLPWQTCGEPGARCTQRRWTPAAPRPTRLLCRARSSWCGRRASAPAGRHRCQPFEGVCAGGGRAEPAKQRPADACQAGEEKAKIA